MKDEEKTKEQLINELEEMRRSAAELAVRYRQEQKEIKPAEQRYRSIFELNPDGILVIDAKGRVLSCNKAFINLTGLSEEEIVGKHFSKLPLLRARDIPKYIKLFASIISGKEIEPFEFTWIHKDGASFTGEFRAALIKSGRRIIGVQAVARDITERKQVAKALRESEAKFSRAFHSNPHPMSIVTMAEGHYLDVNDSYVQTFGFSREELLGRTTTEMGILKGGNAREKILKLLKERKTVKNLELEFYTKSGRKIDILLSGDKVEIGSQTCLLSVLTDITERKQAEEERERLIQELQETLARVNTLSGLLPICAWCKKLRDDKGYWNSVEEYISAHTGAEFTHGMCPECQEKYFPEESAERNGKENNYSQSR